LRGPLRAVIHRSLAGAKHLRGKRAAGHKSELVVYPGLDHQLEDSKVRADMLRRSDAFLRAALNIP
jgi:hypothetical protein